MAESSMASQKSCRNHRFYGNFYKGNPGGWTAWKSSCSRVGFQGCCRDGSFWLRCWCKSFHMVVTWKADSAYQQRKWPQKIATGRWDEGGRNEVLGKERKEPAAATAWVKICLFVCFPAVQLNLFMIPSLRELLQVDSLYQQWNQTVL